METPTREQAEKIVRGILASQAGVNKFAPNLFKDSVDQLMKEYEDTDKLKDDQIITSSTLNSIRQSEVSYSNKPVILGDSNE